MSPGSGASEEAVRDFDSSVMKMGADIVPVALGLGEQI